ncbi:GAP1-N2 domain-containing protein [Actinoallomurus rhizosphaericola]|uniref:GAP1-N2 domain-containing protein n=1 Tax=Actinoallomurus rhizosphaericola TaxID=2952536 RepID=UPI002090221F|nr:hypothetical protein [Actinoallomurus rhizosphaericola]MCO5993281.1 hypothetical protein [Actinoallomurus rhizosphaericola]
MIWRLTYTSAERGPTGRSGFQFVGMTPGTPPGVVGAVTPYMAYRPPPGAPSAPGPEELAGFPTALTYGRADGYVVLARCRYTGRDYSGRYGNFLGQAIVATPEEMEGLRPIEFWDSPLWDFPVADDPAAADDPGATDGPAPADDAAPAVLAPGTAFDPDSLLDRLGGERAHQRLAALLDAVAAVVDAGHGRVVLVAEDAEVVARWIAVVSYSLPAALAADLSFTTYAADPDTVPHVIVGTVPSACPEGGFRLDGPFTPDGVRPGRFARVIADCWRTGDLDGIDAVGELISAPDDAAAPDPARPGPVPDGDVSGGVAPGSHAPGGEVSGGTAADSRRPARVPDGDVSPLDGAAALLALCRGDASVSAGEQAVSAALIRARGVPGWVWPSLRPTLPAVGFDLAAALADAVPEAAERCVRLALADPAVRPRLTRTRLRDGLPEDFRTAMSEAPDLRALAGLVDLAVRVDGAVDAECVAAAAAACARRGDGDVAAAVEATPPLWRKALIQGLVSGLEASVPAVRRAMLTPEACAALGDQDWTLAPRTGGLVLSARADRLTATAALVELEPHGLPDIEDLLGVLWAEAPTVPECRWLVERLGPVMRRFAVLRALPRRVFDGVPLDAEEGVRLARLIHDRLPTLAGPARTVLTFERTLRAGSEEDMARFLTTLRRGDPLHERAMAGVARFLAGRSPAARARVLAAVPDIVRDGLLEPWLAAGLDRRGRADLAEVGARLAEAGVTVAALDVWADGLGRFARRQVESALTDRDPRLAAAWRRARRGA